MRPISLLSNDDLLSWGNDDLSKLLDHFGQKIERVWVDDNGKQCKKISEPLVNPADCQKEWRELKSTVVFQKYPRDSFVSLWQMIAKFHRDAFPNLIKLAELALVLPVHTADVERGFSAQNNILTARRNRLLVETQNMILKQKLEGDRERGDHYMYGLVQRWKAKKDRKLFRLRKITADILKLRQTQGLPEFQNISSSLSSLPSSSAEEVCENDQLEEERLGEIAVQVIDELD